MRSYNINVTFTITEVKIFKKLHDSNKKYLNEVLPLFIIIIDKYITLRDIFLKQSIIHIDINLHIDMKNINFPYIKVYIRLIVINKNITRLA